MSSTDKLSLHFGSSKALGLLAGAALAAFATGAVAQEAPSVSADSFTADFSAMRQLAPLVAQGQGRIGVLLPETTTSARYTSFDQPYLEQAFREAGLPADQFIISNAQGSESTQLTQAQTAISEGATVLIFDPISSGVGVAVETYARERGVKVINYDRLTVGGSRDFYVSFDNVAVGRLIGEGMVSCIEAWNVESPNILVMAGAPTDNNATLFKQGYMEVLQPHFDSGKFVNAGEPAGTWDPPVARTTFEQQLTANQNINAVVTPNDDNANAVIAYLRTVNVPPKTFPTTGQDATLTGLQNVLSGFQCGTVYKAIYLEAQASAALALFLRAGVEPPAALVNGKTMDTAQNVEVPSVLLKPVWVTPENMAATVVQDRFVDVGQLCAGALAEACQAANISQ